MTDAANSHLSRRVLIAGGLALSASPARAQQRVVTMLGDSLTAGYGLQRAQSLPVQVQAQLTQGGVSALVRGAGVSGDTTAGGLARLAFSVQKDTAVCVVALGGNDLLRGITTAVSRANLQQIVDRLQARKIKVVLAGLRVPASVGRGYAQDVERAYSAVGATRGVIFVPDMLAGVAGVKSLNQPDGIHPNAQGAQIVARNLAPAIIRALR